MIRLLLAILISAAFTVDAAEARKRRYYRVVKSPPTPVIPPETKQIRVLQIYCSDNASTFDDLWCNRIDRPRFYISGPFAR